MSGAVSWVRALEWVNFVWGWWLIVAEMGPGQVWVQVVDVDVAADREITFGKSLARGLGDRQDDIQGAIEAGSQAVARSLKSLASPEGWKLGEVSAYHLVTSRGSGRSRSSRSSGRSRSRRNDVHPIPRRLQWKLPGR